MDINTALHVLELSEHKVVDLTELVVKKQYRRLALKTHPDKVGNTSESKQKFQQLNEAYEVTLSMVSTSYDGNDCDTNNVTNNKGYYDILKQFMKSTMDISYSDQLWDKISSIMKNYQDMSVPVFENIERDKAVLLYQFMFLHI